METATPAVVIERVRQASRRVLDAIDELTDERAHEPSRLPGWNRAELITHLARNADGLRGMLIAAMRGESAAMYPGGAEQRAAGIEAGRDERAAVVRADLRKACDELSEAFLAMPDEAWDRVGNTPTQPRAMRELPWVRLREVEIHHVDLGLGYDVDDWPVTFVTGALDEIFGSFPARASAARPLVDMDFRIVSTDHDRAWRVELRGPDVAVAADTGAPADGEVRGWGCDLAAWLYGRDPRGGGIVASGDLGVLRLPQWFPYS